MPRTFDIEPLPHRPVMLNEVLQVLKPKAGEVYVDGTFGAGGYTRAILDAADCRVVAIDRDPQAVADGHRLAASYGSRLSITHATFADLTEVLAKSELNFVDGVVLDIGVSSMQLDQAERGFSFQRNGPLDMRMSSVGVSAADIVNTLGQTELAQVLFVLGEEPRGRAIARAIVACRAEKRLETTHDLVQAVERATGRQHAKDRIHPATKTFQALRVLVNHELSQLGRALIAAEAVLREGGRLVVVTFHSLEDRIVKRFFTLRGGKAPSGSRHQPAHDRHTAATFGFSFRGHLSATSSEIEGNPRARSAKLRAGIRTSEHAGSVNLNDMGVPDLGAGLFA